jgi:hypothetical protein
LNFKQIKGMADGGLDIADDDDLRNSIAKALLKIDEFKTELEDVEEDAGMKSAEAAKILEERFKAEEMERQRQEEERKVCKVREPEKDRMMMEEDERKKWGEVLVAQREMAEKEDSKRARERQVKRDEEKKARLKKKQEERMQQKVKPEVKMQQKTTKQGVAQEVTKKHNDGGVDDAEKGRRQQVIEDEEKALEVIFSFPSLSPSFNIYVCTCSLLR